MLVRSRQRLSTLTVSPTFAINDFPVIIVSTAKSLGVTVDDNPYTEHNKEGLLSGIEVIKRVRHLIPYATLHLTIELCCSLSSIIVLLIFLNGSRGCRI